MSSNALDELYAAFADRRWRLSSACSHCYSDDELRALRDLDPRNATLDQLSTLCISLGNTLGSDEDLAAVAPRLVELLGVQVEDDFIEDRLSRAALRASERMAITRFRRARLLDALRADEAVSRLCSKIEAWQVRLDELLSLLEGPVAPRWYAQLVNELGSSWYELSPWLAVLADGLLDAKQVDALEAAFFAEQDPVHQRAFSTALQVFEWF